MSNITLVTSTPNHDYYLVRSAACMPTNCWGKYVKLGIVRQVRGARRPAQIRDTARGRVVYASQPQFSGKTRACAAERKAAEYADVCRRLARAELRANLLEAADMHRGEGC